FFFQAEDGIRDFHVTGVQTCALPIYSVEVYMQLLQETSSTERSLMSVLPGLTEGCTSVDFRELLYRFKDQIAGQADRLEEMLDRSEERRVGKEGRSGGEP